MAQLNEIRHQTVRVTGQGETKQKAFADALSHIQTQVVKDEAFVTLQITPVAITPVRLNVAARQERFLFLFFPRTRTTFDVVIDVQVAINAIELKTVPFTATTVVPSRPLADLKGGK